MTRGAAIFTLASVLTLPLVPLHADESCEAAYRDGQIARRDGKYSRALELFKICAQSACPEVAQVDCANWLREVEQLRPTVIVVAKDTAGLDLVDARVLIDGEVVAERIDGRTIALDPGEHEVQIVPRQGLPMTRRIVVAEGSRAERVELSMPPAPPQVADAPAPAPAPAPRPAPPTEPQGPHPVTWVFGAVSVTCFGVFAGLAAWGVSGERDLVVGDSPPERIESVQDRYLAADVMLTAGLVFASASAIGLIVWAAEPAAAEPPPKVVVSPLGLRVHL